MAQVGLSLKDVAESGSIDAEDSGLLVLRELGKGLVNYFFMACRTLAIHSAMNNAVKEPLKRLHDVLRDLHSHVQHTHFIAVEGQLYLNDLRIKVDSSAYANAQYVVDLLARHGIGGITFGRPLADEDLRSLLLLLIHAKAPKEGGSEAALESVRAALEKADIPDVEFDRPYFYKSAGSGGGAGGGDVGGGVLEEQTEVEQAALSYAKGVLAVKDYFRAVEAAETANPLRIRKIVQDLVDVAEAAPEQFLRLHTIQGIEDPYYNHCVNVSSLAVAIGRELRLSRIELADLGACAMFHDLGYAALERDAAGAEVTDAQRQSEHPVAGFRALLRQSEYGPGLMRRLLVTLEHHMHWKRPGGWPSLGRKRTSVFTRIVQVADYYDALITPVADRPGMLPVKALERIVAASGTAFDPLIVKALVRVVGRYPYGSLVKLNTGEVGVVTSGGREAESFLKPKVMLVRDAEGGSCPPFEVDLAASGLPRRRVVQVLNPFDEGVTPHAVLFEQLAAATEDERSAHGSAPVPSDAEHPAVAPSVEKRGDELIRELMDRVPDSWGDDDPAALARQSKDLWGDVLTGKAAAVADDLDTAPRGRDSSAAPPAEIEDRTTSSGMPSLAPDDATGPLDVVPDPPAPDLQTDRQPAVQESALVGTPWSSNNAFLPPVDDDYEGPAGHVTELSAPLDDHLWEGPTHSELDPVVPEGARALGRPAAASPPKQRQAPQVAPEPRPATASHPAPAVPAPEARPQAPAAKPQAASNPKGTQAGPSPAGTASTAEDPKAFAKKLAAAYARGGEAAVQELMRTSLGEGMPAVSAPKKDG